MEGKSSPIFTGSDWLSVRYMLPKSLLKCSKCESMVGLVLPKE